MQQPPFGWEIYHFDTPEHLRMITSAISRAMAAPEWMAMPISAADKAGESLMPSPIKPENLSLGEKQKIYLARTLLGNSSCILLDEPGSNLDEKTEHSLIKLLVKAQGKKVNSRYQSQCLL